MSCADRAQRRPLFHAAREKATPFGRGAVRLLGSEDFNPVFEAAQRNSASLTLPKFVADLVFGYLTQGRVLERELFQRLD